MCTNMPNPVVRRRRPNDPPESGQAEVDHHEGQAEANKVGRYPHNLRDCKRPFMVGV